mmetsp:Transcript_111527/g.240366  ORF Transcript_111527/g.240366 Transcript_111527/m.240366 type:complete len:82 (+) Transcript_111527:125-370(+)
MLEMLELRSGLSVADLGSGVGLTGNAMAAFGCTVSGFEYLKASVAIANEMRATIGLNNAQFFCGATNDIIGDQLFDRMHVG